RPHMRRVYLDASALVKLVVREPESGALRRALLGGAALHTSIVGRIELERAARRSPVFEQQLVLALLATLEVLPLHVANAASAAAVLPAGLRTLDAIHLATL